MHHGDSGAPVYDLHRRLALLGYDSGDSQHFNADTETALRSFQGDRGLVVDGICGPQTWNALVEAAHRLGDRLLYYRIPMMRGDDVADLQSKLGQLGFDPRWVDGILGPHTHEAIRQFQKNSGLHDDGLVGRSSITALNQLASRTRSQVTIAEVREHERIRRQPTRVQGRRVVIGDTGELPALNHAISRQLRHGGADVLSFSTPDLGHQASTANDWNSDIYLGVTLANESFAVSYFAVSGFESVGGKALAQRCSTALQPYFEVATKAMRLPILRETRMPAVWCRIGPGEFVVPLIPQLAQALTQAVKQWCLDPGLH